MLNILLFQLLQSEMARTEQAQIDINMSNMMNILLFQLLQSEMARTEQAQIDINMSNMMETKHRMQELDRERDMFKVWRTFNWNVCKSLKFGTNKHSILSDQTPGHKADLKLSNQALGIGNRSIHDLKVYGGLQSITVTKQMYAKEVELSSTLKIVNINRPCL
jgi:hypothetical protein